MNLRSMLPSFGHTQYSEGTPRSKSPVLTVRPVVTIPLSSIGKSGHNMRAPIEDEDEGLWLLAESIRQDGLLHPVIVCCLDPDRPNEFELVAGYRRVRACQLLHQATIPAVVYDQAEVATLFYVENEHREALHPIVRARSTAKLCSEMGITQENLARRLGCERGDITDDLAISRLPQEILEAVLSSEVIVPRSILVEIAQCDDVGRQREMLKLALAGASRETIRKTGLASKARTRASVKRALLAAVNAARGIAGRLDRADLEANTEVEKTLVAELKALIDKVAARIVVIEAKWANVHAGDVFEKMPP